MKKRTLLALAGSTLLLSNSALATTDSVRDWGKWGNLYTAAGQSTVNIPLNFSIADSQNLVDASQFVTEVSVDNGERIYGVMSSWDDSDESFWWFNDSRRLSSAEFTGDENTGSFAMTDENGYSYAASDLTNGHYYSDENRTQGYYYTPRHQIESDSYTYNWFQLNKDADHVFAYAEQYREIYDEENGYSESGDFSRFIGGLTTELNQLQKLAGVTKAVYTGGFSWAGAATITVNFKNSSWDGSFDTNTFFNEGNSAGVITVANGKINGADLSASLANIQSDSSTLTKGAVEASFFGQNASNISGIVDVTSTENGRFVDVFDTAIEGGNTVFQGGPS